MIEEKGNGGPVVPDDVTHPLKLFDIAKSEGRPLYTSAPMVRYSKLAFRQTVHAYGVDLCWTPMILAKEFNRSRFARDSDFTLPSNAKPQIPTIAQFGASSPLEFARASLLIAPYVQGVDLNCGCPQSWACAENLGAALMNKREVVAEMVTAAKGRFAREGLEEKTVSVKIRIHKDLRQTVDFIQTVQSAGIDFITIHGRTRSQRSSVPVSLDSISLLASHCTVPVLANGDVTSLATAHEFAAAAKVDGVMAARALLCNPALFKGWDACPWEAVEVFLGNAARAPLPLKLVVHHLVEMCGPVNAELVESGNVGVGGESTGGALLNKKQRGELVSCGNMLEVIDWLDSVRDVRRL